jgi:transposase InsO family protein
MDLVGPINLSSVSGFKYFLTIVDQYSSFKFVRFLKAKSDTFKEFKLFAAMVENLQGQEIKEVVSDNGSDFISNEFKSFCLESGIVPIYSPPETPKHNGFAERANHTILDKARSLLPKSYWAVLISNMLATPSQSNISPYELWTKLRPPIHPLRAFGFKTFINVPKEHQSWNLGNKGETGILVGFENEATVYPILRLPDEKLVMFNLTSPTFPAFLTLVLSHRT